MADHFIFVYGTLKRGYGNNRVMTMNGGQAEFVSVARTSDKYLLADHGIPFMTRVPIEAPAKIAACAGFVRGEVWRVDDQALANCDRLEGHPDNYRREPLPVRLIDDNGNLRGFQRVGGYFYQRLNLVHADLLRPDRDGVVEWGRDAGDRLAS